MASSSLGKRKEREEHGSTLFVSNLPYTATSTDLQTLFSDIAPVRSAFVVTESGTGVSKGVGYVSFSIKEDAQLAYEKISSEGLNLVGRSLRVQWADNKPKEKGEKESKPIPQPRPRAANDPLAIRTVVVSGLPSDIESKVLWKKFRKYQGAEKVDWPVQVSGQADTAHVLFSTPQTALDAVNKLHAHVFKGNLLSVGLKKRLDNLKKPSDNHAAPSRSARLIVRNISFKTTEQDLRAIFLPYGPIYSIHIPTTESQRSRGFAFVWMMSKKDAERAMEGCNGAVLRAGMAEDMIDSKQKRKKQRRMEKKMKKEDGDGEQVDDDEDAQGGSTEDRIIAVDWALSKDKWEEEKAKVVSEEEEEEEEESSDSDSEDGVGLHDGEESGSGSEDDDEDETPIKPQLPPPEEGTTLFVRNVPFTATEDELRTLFRAFGPLRYARITIDPETGRSRGTGFACFWNKEDADKVVEQSELLRTETGLTEAAAPKQNPFKLPSILTPDPSSSLARSLVLQGRTLDVVRAVTRDQAGKLKEEGEKRREKADKRNMYLLREGVVLPTSPAAEALSPADIERRTNSFNARKTLLKSNPSLYVSKTRLSIRQIPTFVTERMLRRLAIHAVKMFEEEVKKGERNGLTEDELNDVERDQEGDVKTKKKSAKGVLQAKLVRQSERVDPITGKGRSKGYGFVEMHTHADALRVLRWANNNPDVTKLWNDWWKVELGELLKAEKLKAESMKDADRIKRIQAEIENDSNVSKKSKGTLVVEFSIENVQVVQRRKTQQEERKKVGTKEKTTKIKAGRREEALKEEDAPSPRKKQKLAKSRGQEGDAKPKPGQSVGFLIGRKRKERKVGKKH